MSHPHLAVACEHRACTEGTDDGEWPRSNPFSERQKPGGLAVPRDEAFLSGKRLTQLQLGERSSQSQVINRVMRLGNKASQNSAAFVTLATLLPAVLSCPFFFYFLFFLCFLLGVLVVTD